MSNWISDRRAETGHGLNRHGRNGSGRGPLRKIVGEVYSGSTRKEKLECGHVVIPRRDIIGVTQCSSRRCVKCRIAGQAAEIEDTRARILALRDLGASTHEIAKSLGISEESSLLV